MVSEEVRKIKEEQLDQMHEIRKRLYEHPQLRHLFLEVTSRCNARCEHCGSRCDAKEQGKEIEKEYIIKTLDEIAERYDPRTVFLNVTGGEPLMRKDIFDILNYAVSKGYQWGMTTNGMLINKRMFKKLEEAKMCTVSVSIDGLKKTHEEFRKVPNSYDKIIKALKMMNESKVIQVVQVTTVANKKNLKELERLYRKLVKLGIKSWRVVNCDPIGRANDNNHILLDKEDYKFLFNFIKEKQAEGIIDVTYGCSHYLGVNLENTVRRGYFICMTGLYVGSILSNGDIFVCPNVPRRKELIQGNIKKDSFVAVWENKFKEFRHENRTSNKTCKACKHFKYCGGDSFHTWNFDENKPNICLRDMFDEF